MAMMISKFHRLIQSRLLWGIFLVIIVFSFVIWGMVWPSKYNRVEKANAAGTLDGKPVSHAEYRSAYMSTRLARSLALGREIQSTAQTEEVLRKLAWERLATLREVNKLGITATDQELIGTIRSNFSESNGVYNRQRYEAFLQNIIAPLGYTTGQFEQHLREEIAIQKLAHLIGRQAQVTPLEVHRTFDTLMDSFTVEYAALTAADVEKDVKVSEADARKLYDADPAAFTIPEQREISYAAFPVADYMDSTNAISDEDIQDYYELHIEEYTTQETDTNGKPREVVAELDDVRDDIVKALRHQTAEEAADAAASELTNLALPDREGNVPEFAAAVEKTGRTVQHLAPFSRLELPVEDGGAAFVAAAFDLAPNSFDRVSSAIAGKENVYVLYLDKIHEPRVPAFEEAKDRVMAAATQKAVAEALAAKGTELQKAAAAGLADGKTFAQAVAGLGATVASAEPFTGLSGSSSTNEAVQALVQAVVSYNQGEVTDPVPYGDGLLVAYVQARTPADAATFDSYQAEIASAIRARRGQTLFRDWQSSLLTPARFTDLQRPVAAADEEETGADEGAGEQPAPTNTDADMQYL